MCVGLGVMILLSPTFYVRRHRISVFLSLDGPHKGGLCKGTASGFEFEEWIANIWVEDQACVRQNLEWRRARDEEPYPS